MPERAPHASARRALPILAIVLIASRRARSTRCPAAVSFAAAVVGREPALCIVHATGAAVVRYAITTEEVQRLKVALAKKAPKTVNNTHSPQRAAEDGGGMEGDRSGALSNPTRPHDETQGELHDFDPFEQLVRAAREAPPLC